MNADRFDAIAKSINGGSDSRRAVLRWLGGSLLGGVITLDGLESAVAHKKHGGKHHHHHHHRCIKSGKACTIKEQSRCCTGQCGTQGNVVDKCCIPPGGPCDAANCCNGNFGCTNPGSGAVCT